MVKRLTYFLFLMSAVTTMLAHDMIPHHHHEENICFDHSSCETDPGEEETSEKNNSHSDETCCPLAAKLVFTHSSNEDNTLAWDTQHQSLHYDALTETCSFTISNLKLPVFRQHAPIINSYHEFAGISHSLRAPPVA